MEMVTRGWGVGGGGSGGQGTEGPKIGYSWHRRLAQWGLGRKPSTAMLRVALGMRTTKPSRSLEATIWQPRRDLQVDGGAEPCAGGATGGW